MFIIKKVHKQLIHINNIFKINAAYTKSIKTF